MTNSIPASAADKRARAGEIWSWLAAVLYLINAVIILRLPVFPSQDGPVHLYYTDIIRDLLTNSGQYGQYFAIKQLITPYALQYYTLLVLESLFSPEVSEKILLCLYLATFGLGFRYLLNSVARRNSPWVLASVPFAMHGLVFMGFLNYCFAFAITMFLCGLWIRHIDRLDARATLGVAALYLLLMVVHPVPLAIFLGFAGISLAVEIIAERLQGAWSSREMLARRWQQIVLIGVLFGIGVTWVSLFRTDPSMIVTRNIPTVQPQSDIVSKFRQETTLKRILPYSDRSYRSGPMLLVVLAVIATAVGVALRWREIPRTAIVCLLTSIGCYLLYAFAPVPLNGATYFADRFPIAWVMFFFATAAALSHPLGRNWNYIVAAVAIPVSLVVLSAQWEKTSALADHLRPALEARRVQPGSVGVIAGDGVPDKLRNFDPYVWVGAHYFRRSRSVLVNAPWMYLPHIMLQPVRKAEWDFLDPHPMSKYLNEEAVTQLPEPRLSFLVRDGYATDLVISAARRWGLQAAGYDNNFFELFAKPQVLPAIAKSSGKTSHAVVIP